MVLGSEVGLGSAVVLCLASTIASSPGSMAVNLFLTEMPGACCHSGLALRLNPMISMSLSGSRFCGAGELLGPNSCRTGGGTQFELGPCWLESVEGSSGDILGPNSCTGGGIATILALLDGVGVEPSLYLYKRELESEDTLGPSSTLAAGEALVGGVTFPLALSKHAAGGTGSGKGSGGGSGSCSAMLAGWTTTRSRKGCKNKWWRTIKQNILVLGY